jgi:hypothetical protein
MGSGSRRARLAGIALLCLGYVVLLLLAKHHGMESVLLIPAGLLAAALCLRNWSRWQLVAMLFLVFIASLSLSNQLHRRGESLARDHQAVAYRIENVYFSWEIATAHPWLGIGLWAPRDSYLETHEIRYPHVTQETFAQWTRELRTSENTVLTLLADLGFPFVILYGTGVGILLWRLLRASVAGGSILPFHPLVLLLPLTAEALHLQVCDALFQPQINWFFHVLLGMVPAARQTAGAPGTKWSPVIMKLMALATCVFLGALLGLTLPEGTVLDYLL